MINIENKIKYIFYSIIIILLFLIFINIIKKNMLFINRCVSKYDKPDLDELSKKLSINFDTDIEIEDINIKTIDGETLNVFYMHNKNAKGTIIYSYGNAGLVYNSTYLFYLYGRNASIILFDYRGYGMSSGSPSEKGLYNDIYSVWNYFTNERKIKPNTITLMGNSLGCAISSWLAYKLCNSNNKPHALIFKSGFMSIHDVINDMNLSLLNYIIKNEFNNALYLKKIKNKIPILLLHSTDDELIKINHAHELMKVNKYIQFYKINGTHNDLDIRMNLIDKIESFIFK